jgi:hypothetical protein
MDVGVIFGMVIAILVISLVFVFGFQQLNNVQDIQNSAEMIKARQSLDVAVDRVYSGSGESSERLVLSFPSSVSRVCFLPIYDYSFATKIKYTKSRIAAGLEDQGIAGSELAKAVADQREGRNCTVLVFFRDVTIPAWYEIAHLEPSEKDDGFLCVAPRDSVWLQRKFDTKGAWVDAEES